MKSVGEVMAIGRTFKEALWKGMRSLETGKAFGSEKFDKSLIAKKLITPTPDRLSYIRFAMAAGYTVERDPRDDLHRSVVPRADEGSGGVRSPGSAGHPGTAIAKQTFRTAKRYGISDVQLAKAWKADEIAVRKRRKELGVNAVFSRVDTCAAEFESFTPYLYSNYETSCEADPGDRKKVMILGSGPNRIGQGIEFDYCCCHASFALQEHGRRIDHGQLQSRDRLHRLRHQRPPLLRAAHAGKRAQHRRYREARRRHRAVRRPDAAQSGAAAEAPRRAHHRHRSRQYRSRRRPQALRQAARRSADSLRPPTAPPPAWKRPATWPAASAIPVLVRPSYVLGGRAMVIAYDEEMVRQYMREAVTFSQDRPVLVDRFLEDATEVDVDALADGDDVLIAGIMEHIEEAGVHSGDSSCVLPPQSLGRRDAAHHRRLHRPAGARR